MATNSDVIVVTTTRYGNSDIDSVRAEIAKGTFRELGERGYTTLVVDGGSDARLLDEFRSYGAEVFAEKESGMGASRRQVIREAYERDPRALIWMEAEKDDFPKSIAQCVAPVLNGDADMVIPKRESVETYPVFQQATERAGNLLVAELTGRDLDHFFGVKIWDRDCSRYFLDYKSLGRDLWDSIHLPPLHALHEGDTVWGGGVDFNYPAAQREVEEKNGVENMMRRITQLQDLSKLTVEYWKSLGE